MDAGNLPKAYLLKSQLLGQKNLIFFKWTQQMIWGPPVAFPEPTSDIPSSLFCPPYWTVVLAQPVPVCSYVSSVWISWSPFPLHSYIATFIYVSWIRHPVADFLWQPPSSTLCGVRHSFPGTYNTWHGAYYIVILMHCSHFRPDWKSCPGPLCILVGSIIVSEVTFKPCVKVTS